MSQDVFIINCIQVKRTMSRNTWNMTYMQENAMWPQCKHFFINRFSADGNIEHYNFIISAKVVWTQDHGRVCGSKINQLLWQICKSKMMADFDQDGVSLIAISLGGKHRRHCVMKHFQHSHLNINLVQNLVVRGLWRFGVLTRKVSNPSGKHKNHVNPGTSWT